MSSVTSNEITPLFHSQSKESNTIEPDQNVEIIDYTHTKEINDLNTSPLPPNSPKPENNIINATTQKRQLSETSSSKSPTSPIIDIDNVK